MKNRITYNDIMSYDPCYDPIEIAMPRDYNESISNFIKEYKSEVNDMSDIIWLLCRTDYMSEKNLRLFAVWCARAALKLIDNPDQRSIDACDIVFRYAHGEASVEELNAVYVAANAAANTYIATTAAAASYFASTAAANAAANYAAASYFASTAAANYAAASYFASTAAANAANNTNNMINLQLTELERIINSQ